MLIYDLDDAPGKLVKLVFEGNDLSKVEEEYISAKLGYDPMDEINDW